nr:hypothetical protein [Tanacetum cinerariifolium]
MKPKYEGSIGVEIENMNVETLMLGLGGRKCEFDHELGKVEVDHKMFDEIPKKNFGVVHKEFDEMSKESVNSKGADYAESVGVCIGRFVVDYMSELKELKHVASVEEYYDSFIDVYNQLQRPQECILSCFIYGLNEDIRCMVMLFKPHIVWLSYTKRHLKPENPRSLLEQLPYPPKTDHKKNILKMLKGFIFGRNLLKQCSYKISEEDPPSTYMRCTQCPPISASMIMGPFVPASSPRDEKEITDFGEKV